MPCYKAWNDYLEPGTPAYLKAEEEVRAQLQTVKHVVDYYYTANRQPLPDLPGGIDIDPSRHLRSTREAGIRQAMCHHFACEGIHFYQLYDVCSLLNENDKTDRAFFAVIIPCATLMRSDPGKFKHSVQ